VKKYEEEIVTEGYVGLCDYYYYIKEIFRERSVKRTKKENHSLLKTL